MKRFKNARLGMWGDISPGYYKRIKAEQVWIELYIWRQMNNTRRNRDAQQETLYNADDIACMFDITCDVGLLCTLCSRA